MKAPCKALAFLFIACAAAHAQVVPAATGPRGLPLAGTLHYAFRYSQTAEFGTSLGDWQTATPSASLDYTNGNERLPFSLTYGGGYTWTINGPSYSTGLFQRLSLSQGIDWRKWNVLVSDDVSYRPQAPTTGFSGIPGTGEPIGGSGSGPPSSQSILTLNTHVLNNDVNGEIEHSLNYGTSFNVGGSSELLRFPDGNGRNTDTQMANAELAWRLNGRSSLSGTYQFSYFSYPDYGYTFVTNTGFLGYERDWSRKVTTNVSAGPQWTGSSSSTIIPSSIGIAANAVVNCQFRFASASLNYSRGINGGAGYLFGAESDRVNANFSRQFGKDLNVEINGSFRRTAGLQNNGVTNAKFGGGQARKRFGRYLSVFANYTAEDQSSSSKLPANTLGHLMQTVGFGIEYSPRDTHLKH
jgi:hypothetical protein